MDGSSTSGIRSTETDKVLACEYNVLENCSDVVTPRDKTDTAAPRTNKPAVNQELESTQHHHLQIAVSFENGQICDTVSSPELCQEDIENRKCDLFENSAHVQSPTSNVQKAGFSSTAEHECRICQSGGDEALISPCKCSGSAKWVHESCIVKWFQISETSSCELCARDVSIKKKTKPLHEWRLPRGTLGPCSRVDLWYLFVTVFSLCTIIGFGLFHLLVKSKEPETTAVFAAIYALCGVMILLRIHYFYMWFTRRSAFWRKWKTMNRIWKVASPGAVLNVNEVATMV